jgi:hypothetical protein
MRDELTLDEWLLLRAAHRGTIRPVEDDTVVARERVWRGDGYAGKLKSLIDRGYIRLEEGDAEYELTEEGLRALASA